MPAKLTVDGIYYPLDKNITFLENFEVQNIAAKYQCRDGFCGACRVEKVSGDVKYEKQPIAFLRKNEILPCYCCKAVSDLTLVSLY